jgi:hypothetical protein
MQGGWCTGVTLVGWAASIPVIPLVFPKVVLQST